ncbi:hypothetical protein ONZ45_g11100 [Pleurotus djamor]|nr:hypothetical protein ONZ45_g11100 [Pleurotus djamor]
MKRTRSTIDASATGGTVASEGHSRTMEGRGRKVRKETGMGDVTVPQQLDLSCGGNGRGVVADKGSRVISTSVEFPGKSRNGIPATVPISTSLRTVFTGVDVKEQCAAVILLNLQYPTNFETGEGVWRPDLIAERGITAEIPTWKKDPKRSGKVMTAEGLGEDEARKKQASKRGRPMKRMPKATMSEEGVMSEKENVGETVGDGFVPAATGEEVEKASFLPKVNTLQDMNRKYSTTASVQETGSHYNTRSRKVSTRLLWTDLLESYAASDIPVALTGHRASLIMSALLLRSSTSTGSNDMDPLSIAASIVAFLDAGAKLKLSLSKVSGNRAHAQSLARDVFDTLLSLNALYEMNKGFLNTNPEIAPLRVSLQILANDLERALVRFEAYAAYGMKNGCRMNQIVAKFKAWLLANKVEAELSRLRESIQKLITQFHILVSIRSEIAIARLEHANLQMVEDRRARILQFDTLFSQSTHQAYMTLFNQSPLSLIEIQYIDFKARNVIAPLETPSLLVSFSDEDDDISMRKVTCYYRDSVPAPTRSMMAALLCDLATIQNHIHAKNVSHITRGIATIVMRLVSTLHVCQCSELSKKLLNVAEKVLRRTLNDPNLVQGSKDNLYYWLSSAIIAKLHFMLPQGERVELAREAIDLCRMHLTSPTSRCSILYRRVRLNFMLNQCGHLINANDIYATPGEAVATYLDALKLLSLDEWSSLDEGSAGWSAFHPYALQSYIRTLFLLSNSYGLNGEYTRAYYTGRDCIAAMDKLLSCHFRPPRNFSFFSMERLELEQGFCSMTSIVRGPYFVHVEGESNEEEGLVQWGEAL